MADIAAVRAELKTWERTFKAQNGREPSVHDIKAHPTIGPLSFLMARLPPRSHRSGAIHSGEVQTIQAPLQIRRSFSIYHEGCGGLYRHALDTSAKARARRSRPLPYRQCHNPETSCCTHRSSGRVFQSVQSFEKYTSTVRSYTVLSSSDLAAAHFPGCSIFIQASSA
jgi:hypothetical protein